MSEAPLYHRNRQRLPNVNKDPANKLLGPKDPLIFDTPISHDNRNKIWDLEIIKDDIEDIEEEEIMSNRKSKFETCINRIDQMAESIESNYGECVLTAELDEISSFLAKEAEEMSPFQQQEDTDFEVDDPFSFLDDEEDDEIGFEPDTDFFEQKDSPSESREDESQPSDTETSEGGEEPATFSIAGDVTGDVSDAIKLSLKAISASLDEDVPEMGELLSFF